MKYDIHKKYRFDFDYNEDEYNSALDEYKLHLRRINFKKAPDLLKYFGLSFFHDGTIKSLEINTMKRIVTLSIFREDDRCDINELRHSHGLKEIEYEIYEQNPILYKCDLFEASTISLYIDDLANLNIIDSELDFQGGNFVLCLSVSDTHEIVISCASARVEIINKELIKRYTDNLSNNIPYCSHCKEKLIE